jgi:flagellar biosynthesis protein FlhA
LSSCFWPARWPPWPGNSRSSEHLALPAETGRGAPVATREAQEASWADVTPLDVLGLEVGYRLIPLVDKSQDGELLRRIRGIRKKFAQEVGFLVSPVHIRDNLELKPNAYKILLKGVEIGEGEAFPGNLLAINPGRVAGRCPVR